MTTSGTSASAAQLPPMDAATGFLPPGIHPCSLDEFKDVFVDNAPHPEHRIRRFRALEVYIDCIDEMFPESTLWLDGGFVSHKVDPPFDIDVLAKVKPAAWASVMRDVQAEATSFEAWDRGGQVGYPPKTPVLAQYGGLQTHQMAAVGPAVYPRIQPFGGRIDSFIFPADMAKALANFRRDWMVDIASGTKKGFVEVKLS